MVKKTGLERYKDPKARIRLIDKFNRSTYRNFTFRLHKINDQEIIEAIDRRTVSLPELIKAWYKKSN